MEFNTTGKINRSIANFAALKTAIANGEEDLVDELLGNDPMQDIEKSYLIDLAKLNGNQNIIERLEAISLRK